MQAIVHPTLAELEAFDRGKLARAEWTAVEQHLLGCPDCSATLDRLPTQSLDDLMRELLREADTPALLSPQDTPLYPPPTKQCDIPAALAEHARYEIIETLGAGGMGQVFKARHRLMERVVALKILHAALLERPGAAERFRQEVRAAARLSHPNIVAAHDADEAGGVHFLVMEFVEGETLERRLHGQGPLPVSEACGLIQQAARGLQHAFERGMVHRDLKPSNLILTPEGTLKILDFGLARFVSEQPQCRALTPSETLVGTPAYLAPEQARDPRQSTIRADIYSLGCTLYHLLTGQPPFPGGTLLQNLLSHQEQTAKPASEFRDDVPARLDAVVARMLAKDPRDRFQTPAEVVDALAHFADARPPASASIPAVKNRWRWLIAAGLAAILMSLTVYALVWPGFSRSPAGPAPKGEPAVDNGGKGAPAATTKEAFAPPGSKFQPHVPKADLEEISLPGAVKEAAVGGAGRYLVLHVPARQQLAIYDVQAGKLAQPISLAEDEDTVHFAAGANKLIIIQPFAKLVEIWDLKTQQKERTAPLPAALADNPIHQVCMGSASAGPLFVYIAAEKRTLQMDFATLETAEVRWNHFGPTNAYGPLRMRASPDGSMLLGWGGGWAGLDMATFLQGRQQDAFNNFAFSGGAYALPSADGKLIFAHDTIFTRAGSPGVLLQDVKHPYMVPAHEPGFFLALQSTRPLPAYTFGRVNLPPVDMVAVYSDARQKQFAWSDCKELNVSSTIPWEQRVHYYPSARLLVTLADDERLILRRAPR